MSLQNINESEIIEKPVLASEIDRLLEGDYASEEPLIENKEHSLEDITEYNSSTISDYTESEKITDKFKDLYSKITESITSSEKLGKIRNRLTPNEKLEYLPEDSLESIENPPGYEGLVKNEYSGKATLEQHVKFSYRKNEDDVFVLDHHNSQKLRDFLERPGDSKLSKDTDDIVSERIEEYLKEFNLDENCRGPDIKSIEFNPYDTVIEDGGPFDLDELFLSSMSVEYQSGDNRQFYVGETIDSVFMIGDNGPNKPYIYTGEDVEPGFDDTGLPIEPVYEAAEEILSRSYSSRSERYEERFKDDLNIGDHEKQKILKQAIDKGVFESRLNDVSLKLDTHAVKGIESDMNALKDVRIARNIFDELESVCNVAVGEGRAMRDGGNYVKSSISGTNHGARIITMNLNGDQPVVKAIGGKNFLKRNGYNRF